MRDQSRIWDRFARRYVKSPIADVETYEWKLGITQSYMRPEMEVLEIGCGSGNTGRRHAEFVKSYTALDISAAMIEAGRAEGPVPANMTYVHANFDDWDVGEGSYDMILALSVLHLVPDPAATVAKIARTLRPGGVFVSSTVMLHDFRALKLFGAVGQAVGLIPRLAFLAHGDLVEMFKAAGLEIELDKLPEGHKARFVVARKGIGGASLRPSQ